MTLTTITQGVNAAGQRAVEIVVGDDARGSLELLRFPSGNMGAVLNDGDIIARGATSYEAMVRLGVKLALMPGPPECDDDPTFCTGCGQAVGGSGCGCDAGRD